METESDEALQSARKTLDVYRSLAAYKPEVYRSLLAERMSNLSIRLSDSGPLQEALEYACEAVEIYRKLSQDRPESYRPALAANLALASNQLGSLGRYEKAVEFAREVVEIYREFSGKGRAAVEAKPENFLPELAGSLHKLEKWLSRMGRHDEAEDAIYEAVAIYRKLAELKPLACWLQLAESLQEMSEAARGRSHLMEFDMRKELL